ncbi:hypothetical protein [Natrinema hispanicum]|uniref:hypothetical protein n=1 Tax=Natrinema hispanicum TaxID=392421 RepID=UPI001114906A|nr:hypothetical protein [Natrinema hispanicum]
MWDGIIAYLIDALVFNYAQSDDFPETRLAVESQQLRDANHSREHSRDVSVHQQVNLCSHHFPGQ